MTEQHATARSRASPYIEGLRSVSLAVPNLRDAQAFYVDTWKLQVVAREERAVFLAGSGPDHHLLALHEQEGTAAILDVTLRARSAQDLIDIQDRCEEFGGHILERLSPSADPAGGQAIRVQDPDGRVFRLVHGDRPNPGLHAANKDMPRRLAHAVLNSAHVEKSRVFVERVLGFSLSDRTKIMAFMRCNSDHHSIALADADNHALNHIAFEMPNADAVMRGGGRMKDAGYPIEWGPGRHGPGDNTFNYFVGPFDVVIEYTADVQQVDDSYRVGAPSDWTWPPGRVDQWGISPAPSARLKEAQKRILFRV